MKLSVIDRNHMLSGELRQFLECRLCFALSRFDSRIRHMSVALEGVNSPRGGLGKLCRITVELDHMRDIVITDQDLELAKCIAHAAERAGRAVARAIDRSRYLRRPRLRDADSMQLP